MSKVCQINSFIRGDRGLCPVTIFGYRSKGLNSLDLIGLGNRGNIIREKFLFLTRLHHLKMPLGRYVFSYEIHREVKNLSSEEQRWLELPLLISYLQLAGQIPVCKLDDCLAAGEISIQGEITHLAIPWEAISKLQRDLTLLGLKHLKYFSPARQEFSQSSKVIRLPSLNLLSGINLRQEKLEDE